MTEFTDLMWVQDQAMEIAENIYLERRLPRQLIDNYLHTLRMHFESLFQWHDSPQENRVLVEDEDGRYFSNLMYAGDRPIVNHALEVRYKSIDFILHEFNTEQRINRNVSARLHPDEVRVRAQEMGHHDLAQYMEENRSRVKFIGPDITQTEYPREERIVQTYVNRDRQPTTFEVEDPTHRYQNNLKRDPRFEE